MTKLTGKNVIVISIVVSVTTGLFINLFLAGKIIDIPHGTHKGGVISAIGVAVILCIMFIVALLTFWILKRNQKSE
jgi:hypothetical protein